MTLLISFLIGFGASVLGSLPPGIISLTVVDIASEKRFNQVVYFSIGASLTEFFQVLIAVFFSSLIKNSPLISGIIEYGSVLIFLALGGYFFFANANQAKLQSNSLSRSTSFVKGTVISLMNMLAIPFWIFWSAYFHTNKWINLELNTVIYFAGGISLGTFLVLIMYGKLSLQLSKKYQLVQRWTHLIIALLFLVLACYQFNQILGKS